MTRTRFAGVVLLAGAAYLLIRGISAGGNYSGQSISLASVSDSIVSGLSKIGQIMTRGYRNNNPGNIRISSSPWLGKVPDAANTDGSFEQFTSPEYGIRAIYRILTSYYDRGINTVSGIISTWAPSTENNTGAYIAAVATQAGLDPNIMLSQDQLALLVPGIIQHENGFLTYDSATIAAGIALA